MPSADLVIRGPSSLSTSSNPRPRRWLCPAASVRDLEYADEHRHDARQRRRHAAPGRHQDLGRRLTVDRQHRPVLSLSGHRCHPHHRRATGLVRTRELTRASSWPRSSARISRRAGRWRATFRATQASTRSSTSTKKRCGAGLATITDCASNTDLDVRATFLAGRQVYGSDI
jgi:hypothetical protein